jgi:hypothetical protein
LAHECVATDSGLIFIFHAERGGRYMVDAVPDVLAPDDNEAGGAARAIE